MDKERFERGLMTCVHCGFCLNACPTYLETGSEADSPRGRIVMMRAMYEGRLAADSPDLRRHIDLCLGCRACEPACPSGVPYGDLVEQARAEVNRGRPPAQTAARRALLAMLSDPSKLRIALGASKITGGLPGGFQRLLQGDPSEKPGPLPALRIGEAKELPARVAPVGKRRARVGLLTGCAMRVMYGDVHVDAADSLAANGCEVLVNQAQGCCGALHAHNGFPDDARKLARSLIDSFGPIDGLDAIAVDSAGCGSMLKEYAQLLEGDAAYEDRARILAAKCKDICELLDDLGWIAPLRQGKDTVATYHDACHLAQAQRIVAAPRRLLGLIPGLSLVDMPESEVCCGSAGIYNLTEPAMARALQRRKVQSIAQTGAAVVATGNPGCMAWIAAGLAGAGIEVVHPVTLLRRALA